MFGILPKENSAILDFYLKDCCFDTHINHQRKRASPCFYSQHEENEERPLKSRRLGASPEKVDDVIIHDSDAESACQSGYHEDNDQSFTNETLADEIHRQELNAYRSTIEALHASGPLTWEKETMLSIGPKYWLVRLLPHQLVDVGTMWKAQKYFCYMWYDLEQNYTATNDAKGMESVIVLNRLELAVRMVNGSKPK
ncbi:EMSY domain-containing protein [Tanacetum coccineum]